MQSRKAIVMIAGVVVAAGVGILVMTGVFPPRNGTEGAIGAAKRYQSQQISDQDVTLDDTQVATFIQSDSFRKLATDPKFREAARSESFGKVIESNSIREASARVDLGQVLEQAAIRELLGSEEFAKAVQGGQLMKVAADAPELFTVAESGRLKEMLNGKGMAELAKNTEFQNLAAEYGRRLEAAMGTAEAGRRLEAAQGTTEAGRRTTEEGRRVEAAQGSIEGGRRVTDQFAMTEFNRLLNDHASLRSLDGMKSLEANRHLPEVLSKGFMELFANREVASFATDGLRRILDQQNFMEALKTEGFTQLMEGLTVDNLAAVRDVASSPEMLSVLSDATYREAAQHAELSMAASTGLEAAVQRIEE